VGRENGIGARQLDGMSHGCFWLCGLTAMAAATTGVEGMGLGWGDRAGRGKREQA
jgi:hypothetical protein